MSASLLIREPLGTRQVVTPLRLGGVDADVVVPGLPAAVVRIDHSGGKYWVRPDADAQFVVGAAEYSGTPQALQTGRRLFTFFR